MIIERADISSNALQDRVALVTGVGQGIGRDAAARKGQHAVTSALPEVEASPQSSDTELA